MEDGDRATEDVFSDDLYQSCQYPLMHRSVGFLTQCQSTEGIVKINKLLTPLPGQQSLLQQLHFLRNSRLQLQHLGTTEILTESSSSHPMDIMVSSRPSAPTSNLINVVMIEPVQASATLVQDHIRRHDNLPKSRLIPPPRPMRVDLGIELDIIHVDFIRSNSHSGPILLVELAKFEDELPLVWVEVVVELVVIGQSCEAGTRDVSNAGEVKTVDGEAEGIEEERRAQKVEYLRCRK